MRRNRDRRLSGVGALAILAGALLASCASSSDDEFGSTDAVTSAAPSEPTAEPESEPTLISEPTAMPEPTTVPQPTAVPTASPEPTAMPAPTATVEPTPTPEPAPDCVLIADFSSPDSNTEWLVVNDNVMGGRSLGDRSFADGTMTFAGVINTDGGGFASIRLALPPGALSTADRLVLRGRSDGRSYLITLDDGLPGRTRRISFRAPLAFTTAGEWETVTVPLSDLYAAYFGERVEAQSFRPDLATRIGIMQSDGIDGEFVIEIDRIEACG